MSDSQTPHRKKHVEYRRQAGRRDANGLQLGSSRASVKWKLGSDDQRHGHTDLKACPELYLFSFGYDPDKR